MKFPITQFSPSADQLNDGLCNFVTNAKPWGHPLLAIRNFLYSKIEALIHPQPETCRAVVAQNWLSTKLSKRPLRRHGC